MNRNESSDRLLGILALALVVVGLLVVEVVS